MSSGLNADLSVYLIHYAAPDWCASAVRSIQSSRGVRLEIAVVDNGGGQDLPTALPDGVRIIRTDENCGFAGGANRAIGDWLIHCPADSFVVIGSHDLHVAPDTLRILLAEARRYEQFGVLAPLVAGREHRLPSTGGTTESVIRVEWVSGTCMLLRKQCIENIRGFDEAFGSYVEDVDLCLRAADAGWLTGVVLGTRAWGLGRAHQETGDVLMAANGVLLAYRRKGSAAAAQATGALAGQVARNVVGAVSPKRSKAARQRSRYWAAVHIRALRHVWTIRRHMRNGRHGHR